MARVDDGTAQEIAADKHEQWDQDAAPMLTFLCMFAEHTDALQEPGQNKSAAEDQAPESSSFPVGTIANEGMRGATRTT